MLSYVSFLWLVGILLIPPAIVVPPAGALVRLWAHYNPKGLQLDLEGGVQPHTGPVITSFIAMLMRVYKMEGWPGLYKGFMPTLLLTSIQVVTLFLLRNSNLLPTGVPGMLVYGLFDILILLPRRIITDRAITTPHKLPYFDAIYSLRILLTPTERRRPWILYLTPGLLAAQVFRTADNVLWLTTQQPGWRGVVVRDIYAIKLATLFVLALANTVVLTPLEVIATRLAIQRNHAAPEFNSVSQEEEDDTEEAAEYVGIGEDVIGLRTEQEPYIGLVDCAKRIIDEEGWSALYRAWWLMLLHCLGKLLVLFK